MYYYKISWAYKQFKGKWGSWTISSGEELSNEYLIELFGLHDHDVLDFKIEQIKK